jgi:hypothetical protein
MSRIIYAELEASSDHAVPEIEQGSAGVPCGRDARFIFGVNDIGFAPWPSEIGCHHSRQTGADVHPCSMQEHNSRGRLSLSIDGWV